MAPSLRVELNPIDATNANEIESAVREFTRQPNGGLIVPPSSAALAHGELIFSLAAKQRLPAVYPSRSYVEKGGLICKNWYSIPRTLSDEGAHRFAYRDDRSARAFAVKPRASGAPLRGCGA